MVIGGIELVLTFAALLGACVWIGGFVAIVVVVRVARRELEAASQVAFFRALGRSYLPVGVCALVVALGAGGWLMSRHRWSGVALATLPVAAALVLALVAGVAQARGMTRLRRRLLETPADGVLALRVRRGALRAAALRAVIGLLSLGLLALAAVLASSK